MKRTAIAIVLALAALALLLSLALESRSLPVEVHVAQNAIKADLERIDEHFRTLVETLNRSWQEQQAPGEGTRALLVQFAAEPRQIPHSLFDLRGTASQQSRLVASYEAFTAGVADAAKIADDVLSDQTEYVASVAYLRESGTRVIEQLRAQRFDRVASDAFQLVVGTLDYAGPRPSVQESELRRLLVALGRAQRTEQLPAEVERLRGVVDTILTNKPRITTKLEQLAVAPVVEKTAVLTQASQSLYQTAVARVDRARLMLSIYAVALLAAVGLIALRLRSSYREINAANEELEVLNQSLEQRVAERTNELAGTLADLKESQVQLVQAEKMSSLGQLVAGISHEINTPLLYLANNAELVRERIGVMREFVASCAAAFAVKSEDFKDRAEYQAKFVHALKDVKTMLREEDLEGILEEADDLTRDSIEGLGDLTAIAQSLKDFSRLDRAPVSSFDVNGGLDKTLLIAKNVVKHKANVTKMYGELPEIECSPSQINQVFLNIITNAAQAIEQHGEIVITTKLHDADHVAIRIADTGCGIPPENLAKIRDPFFTTKEVGTGTGLGLSIVDEIVRKHHGQLLVESEVGKGSAFTVVLPIKRPQGPADTAAAEAEPEVPGGDDFFEPLAEAV
jgi:signal transduction histidine kinase